MDKKIRRVYYNPKGYWRGVAAVKKLAAAAKVSEADARSWLKKQVIWQVYLPAQRHIPRPMFDEDSRNAVHQADVLYLPHDRGGRRTYKYALTVVDVASRYKDAETLSDKSAIEVAAALGRIYKRGPLTWPRLLQVDSGVSSWAQSGSCWLNIMYRCGAALPTTTVSNGSRNGLTAR